MQTYLDRRGRRLRPDLDEFALRQMSFSYLPVIFTSLASFGWATAFFLAGLPSLAWPMLAFALITLSLDVAAIYRPRFTSQAALLVGLCTLLISLGLHGLAGGYGAGLWSLAWVAAVPLSVFLSAGRRGGLFMGAITLIVLLVAALLNTRFAQTPLQIPDPLAVIYNTYALARVVMMGLIWNLYVFGLVQSARQEADGLLLSILPASIAARLKRDRTTIANAYDNVTVLFADIVGFTQMSAGVDPAEVVEFLNIIFSDFDDLALKHGLEKIKTIGDAYMVAGGLPTPRVDHCEAVVAFAFDMLEAVGKRKAWLGEAVRLRVGINSGPVVAGVIGHQKFIYDLWGDTVNTASRMESNGVADVIQVTEAVKNKLTSKYEFEERPPIFVKGKGEMITYLLRPREELPVTPFG